LIIIGNKNDLKDRHEFGRNELHEIASKYRCPYLTTSAKDGGHVENAFRGMGLSLIQGFLQSRK
jgi:hypothetical protein